MGVWAISDREKNIRMYPALNMDKDTLRLNNMENAIAKINKDGQDGRQSAWVYSDVVFNFIIISAINSRQIRSRDRLFWRTNIFSINSISKYSSLFQIIGVIGLIASFVDWTEAIS